MGTAYSLGSTTVTAGGAVLEGFGEGDVVEISRESAEWEHVKNADGAVVNCAILDRSAMVTIRTRYNSPANSHLQSLRESGDYFEFTVEWPNGDQVRSGETLIHKAPEVKDGQKVSNREWQLFCNRLEDTFAEGEGA